MDWGWPHFMMCTFLLVWVQNKELIMLSVLFVQTYSPACVSYVNSQNWKESPVSLLSSHTTALHPSPFFFYSSSFHEIFTLRVEAVSSLSFLRHSQMSAAACLSGLRAALIFIWKLANRQTWFNFAKFILIDLSRLVFSFLCDARDMSWSLCLLCLYVLKSSLMSKSWWPSCLSLAFIWRLCVVSS